MNLSDAQIEKFWKKAFLSAMQRVAPNFKIDESNKAIIQELYKWIWAREGRGEPGILDINKGLLLWGPIGTGKTTLLKGIQKYYADINMYAYGCSNKSIGYEMKSAAEISLRYSMEGLAALSRWTEKDVASNLIIDEIGREEESKYFGTPCNTIQTILQLRYEQRFEITTLASTNIDMATGKEFISRYGEYIFDRVREMFNIIAIDGISRR